VPSQSRLPPAGAATSPQGWPPSAAARLQGGGAPGGRSRRLRGAPGRQALPPHASTRRGCHWPNLKQPALASCRPPRPAPPRPAPPRPAPPAPPRPAGRPAPPAALPRAARGPRALTVLAAAGAVGCAEEGRLRHQGLMADVDVIARAPGHGACARRRQAGGVPAAARRGGGGGGARASLERRGPEGAACSLQHPPCPMERGWGTTHHPLLPQPPHPPV
jgi:hypothetical protein